VIKRKLKKTPLGLSDFQKIIKNNLIYIDKTQLIYHMITEGENYFLSRPRRFGKSLLISTLEALFSGKKELFKDLWINQSDWDWPVHPVVKIDFSRIDYRSADRLEKSLIRRLRIIAKQHNITLEESESAKDLFGELIDQLAEQNTVALLIDEYDKPILDYIEQPEEAKACRDILKDFYGVIKSVDQSLRFVILTGVSKFAKTSVFSGINNLEDITLDQHYATLLGYTQQELEHYFVEYISILAHKSEKTSKEITTKLIEYYDGYQFAENSPKVFNPYSVLTCFKKQAFGSYWFESGTPTFLIKLVQKNDYDLEDILKPTLNERNLGSFEPDNIPLSSLLFQTGYLTIDTFDSKTSNYTLKVPNQEVNTGLTTNLVDAFTQLKADKSIRYAQKIAHAFARQDMIELQTKLQEFFNRMPYTVHVTDEYKFQFVLYSIFALIGVTVDPEVTTSLGRADLIVSFPKLIFVIELKFNKTAQEALDQIKDKKYYEKYENIGKKITLTGINFNATTKSVEIAWQLLQ